MDPTSIIVRLQPNEGLVMRGRRIGGFAYPVVEGAAPSLTFQALLSDKDMGAFLDTSVALMQGWTVQGEPTQKPTRADKKKSAEGAVIPPNPLCRCQRVSLPLCMVSDSRGFALPLLSVPTSHGQPFMCVDVLMGIVWDSMVIGWHSGGMGVGIRPAMQPFLEPPPVISWCTTGPA